MELSRSGKNQRKFYFSLIRGKKQYFFKNQFKILKWTASAPPAEKDDPISSERERVRSQIGATVSSDIPSAKIKEYVDQL